MLIRSYSSLTCVRNIGNTNLLNCRILGRLLHVSLKGLTFVCINRRHFMATSLESVSGTKITFPTVALLLVQRVNYKTFNMNFTKGQFDNCQL